MSADSTPSEPAAPAEPGLKANAIGFVDALVIGLASTAPAYSIAAVIGIVVVSVGVQAPAVLLASFVPMFFIAAAFYYMNKADQDCGTTFSWVTRAMGPFAGWIGGWAICTTGILVIGSLADVAARYAYELVGIDASLQLRTLTAVVIIAAMTYVCVIGTEISARHAEHPDRRPGRRAAAVHRGRADQGRERRRRGGRRRASR